VEVVARGDTEDLAALEEALRQGPRHSRVADVEKNQISDEVDLETPFQVK
jgi:acylphosphatase